MTTFRDPKTPVARVLRRAAAGGMSVVMLAVALVGLQPAVPAQALDGTEFNAGYIIDDSEFYDGDAMSEAQIQAFLELRQPGVCGNSLCLKNYRETTQSRPQRVDSQTQRLRCGAYAGAANERASSIIFKAQSACGISARVLLVTLQKEQGLIEKSAPSDAAMKRAMGYACPDTAPCAATSLGFGNQVYLGALQLNTYRASDFGAYKPGVNTVNYHPSASCGTSTFVIQNYATAALYNYTPYRPNAAALANLGGIGDACSSYGNRNFWVFYSNWFGGPTGSPTGVFEVATAASANRVQISGWAVDPDRGADPINVRVRGAGWSTLVAASATNSGSTSVFPGAGRMHGFSADVYAAVGSQQVCVDAVNFGRGADTSLGCKTVTVSSPLRVTDRIAGPDRFSTAIAVSRRAFAPGVAVAYVASGAAFPDALSGTPVAAAGAAPVLLVGPSTIPDGLIAELTRLRPAKIVVIGGLQAVSESVVSGLATVAPVERLAGSDRYSTSLAVADGLGVARSGRAYIVSGRDFPDALSAASAAGFQDAPLLLVDGIGAVSPETAAALRSWGVTNVTVVGGPAAVSALTVESLRSVPGVTRVDRIGGADRFATSAAVNAAVYPRSVRADVASGLAFADGLVGGAVSGRDGVPLLLARTDCVSPIVIDRLLSAGTTSVRLFGGGAVLAPPVERFTPCG